MLKSFVSRLILGTSCLLLVAPAWADSPKALVKLSLASYNKVKMDTGEVTFVQESPEMPVWMSSMFRLYAEGRDLRGIDRARPWGAVIQHGSKVSAYGFVPVTDAETLGYELSEFIDDRTEVSPGIYKVEGRQAGQQLYAKESGGWLFISDSAETLASVPWDPARELGGMDGQYDVAVRLQLNNVPAEAGKKILAELDKSIGAALRNMSSDQTVEILGQMAMSLDEVTLGWSKQ